MGEILDRAVDPRQYDRPDVNWQAVGATADSPTRLHYWNYLEPYQDLWKGKDVIEIGSGSGWLLDKAVETGANLAIGIEPSVQNYEAANQVPHPHAKTLNFSLEDYASGCHFGVALAVRSFDHIADIGKAFRKIHGFLTTDGELLAIVPDYNYYHQSRKKYQVEIEKIGPEEYAALMVREHGTLADVVRTVGRFASLAQENGMCLLEDVPIPPYALTAEEKVTLPDVGNHLLRFGIQPPSPRHTFFTP